MKDNLKGGLHKRQKGGSVSDKILLAVYELDNERKPGEKITKEKLVVKAWELFPSDFCMKGYPQFPNADACKYITKLFRANLLKGSSYNYRITPKGEEYAKALSGIKSSITKDLEMGSREIMVEIERIKRSKIFNYFIGGGLDFIEGDFFDFLGTSSRSLVSSNKTAFLTRYNFMVGEVIPFCERVKNNDSNAKMIIVLWSAISRKFQALLIEQGVIKNGR